MTTPIVVPNIIGWGIRPVGVFDSDESETGVELVVDFYTGGAINNDTRSARIVRQETIFVTNEHSTRLGRNPSPTGINDLILRQKNWPVTGARDALLSAWESQALPAAKQKALADEALSLGIINSSLAGVTS